MRHRMLATILIAALTGLAPILAISPARALAPLELDYTTEPPGGLFGGVYCPAPVVYGYIYHGDGTKTIFGRTCFVTDGDKFFLADMLNDGQRVAVHWRLINGDRRGLCVNKDGDDYEWCDKNLPENEPLEIRIGRCDGTYGPCDTPDDYNHWSTWAYVSH